MIVTLALLLASATPVLAASLWRRRRVRIALRALGPGKTAAYSTIAGSRQRF